MITGLAEWHVATGSNVAKEMLMQTMDLLASSFQVGAEPAFLAGAEPAFLAGAHCNGGQMLLLPGSMFAVAAGSKRMRWARVPRREEPCMLAIPNVRQLNNGTGATL